ncbi:MAG TPA: flavodoxin domain-containing protein [Acidobacteriaceae bacterium]|nr:flavodoxin domain-containing protein [Acidobacteriaceae bacterium]
MPATVLVTWVTRYGSTEDVAHAVADDLLQQGLAVHAQPLGEVATLDRYSAVVLGCALYMARLHKDARRFLAAHREELLRRPVCIFVLGPIHADPKEFAEAERQLGRELAQFPWFKPVAQQVIGGRFDPDKLGFPFRMLPPLRKVPASDARDWDAIHAWAGHLPSLLQPSPAR